MRARFRGAANNGTFTRFFRCALNTETINEKRKNNSFAVFYLKTLSRHAHRSIIKDYFFNCFSFWQIKNIYVNSALTSQFRYVCRMWVLSYCTTARSGYLFSCLITCLHGYKIGHEKRINKVLFPCVDTLNLFQFWHGGHNS